MVEIREFLSVLVMHESVDYVYISLDYEKSSFQFFGYCIGD